MSVPLSYLSPHDARFDVLRAANDRITLALSESQIKPKNFDPEIWADRMKTCSRDLHFKQGPDNKIYLNNALFCRVPICPICLWRKSLKNFAVIGKAFNELTNDDNSLRFILLTLTIPNCSIDSLKDNLKKLSHSFTKLLKRKSMSFVLGYLRSLEITYNKANNTLHPHYHTILIVRKSYFSGREYLSQNKFIDLWRQSLNYGSGPLIVDVRKIKSNPRLKNNLSIDSEYLGGLLETTKYFMKVVDIETSIDNSIEIFDQLYGHRKISTGGILRQYLNDKQLDCDNSENLINITDNRYSDTNKILSFIWKPEFKKYLLMEERQFPISEPSNRSAR